VRQPPCHHRYATDVAVVLVTVNAWLPQLPTATLPAAKFDNVRFVVPPVQFRTVAVAVVDCCA
jgi:hypothetical protein